MNKVAPVLLFGGLVLTAYVTAQSLTGLKAVGNQIQNGAGQVVRLIGINRPGMEYSCIQGWGMSDGPMDQASITAIKSWGANTVRIPLNEQCWLSVNNANPTYSGVNYKNALKAYVDLLTSNGMVAILDLHWTAAGSSRATEQTPMPNTDYSVTFWSEVAQVYKSYSNVIFDLFNEPYPGHACNDCLGDNLWLCWRDGGSACNSVSNIWYPVAGMQTIINAVRATGSTNLLMLGGLSWANSLEKFLTYLPQDTLACPQLVASWHSYATNYHKTQALWDSTVAPVAAQIPLVVGEIGQYDCAYNYINTLMDWLDAKQISYLGWAWLKADCGGTPSLISDYNGTPTNFGIGFKNHILGMNRTSSLTPIVPAPGTCPTPAPTTAPITTTVGPTATTTAGPTTVQTLTVSKVTGWNDYYMQISIVPNNAVTSVSAQYYATGATQTVTVDAAPSSWNVPQYIKALPVAMPKNTAVTITVVLSGGATQVYTLYNGVSPVTAAPGLTVSKVTASWNDWYMQISVVPNSGVASVSAQYVGAGLNQYITLAAAPAAWNVPQYLSSLTVQMPNPTEVLIEVKMNSGAVQVYSLWNGVAPPTTTPAPTTTTTTTTLSPSATTTASSSTGIPSTTTANDPLKNMNFTIIPTNAGNIMKISPVAFVIVILCMLIL